jgi:hypothetical protein
MEHGGQGGCRWCERADADTRPATTMNAPTA